MTEVTQPPRPGAFYDIDGTVFKSSLLEKLVKKGIEQRVFSSTAFERALEVQQQWQMNNSEGTYVAYTDLLVGAFVTSIAGVEVARIDALTRQVVDEYTVRRFRFPQTLMRVAGRTHTNVIISGSPDFAVEAYTADLQAHLAFGSTFEHEQGIYTGVASSVGDKARIRQQLIDTGQIAAENNIAIGDTMGDKSILGAVAIPIMHNPSRTLRDYGAVKGWPIVLEQKDNITVLQPTKLGDDGVHEYTMTSQDVLLNTIERQLTT